MRKVIVLLSTFVAISLMAVSAMAEKRVALVIGNDRYSNLPADQQLQKAGNDARAMGDALRDLGFQVIRGENLARQAIVDKLDEFTGQLTPGDVAFFFFAGHGVAIGGGNYLLPTDVPNVGTGQETRLARAALAESDIVADLQSKGVRVALVVLDACRNNPFRRPGVRSVGGERGFVRTDPVRGVFTIYSAGVGQTALDRLSEDDPNPNSVFTRVLAPALKKPGMHLGDLAFEVREEVSRLARTVGHEQRPASYDETIGGRIYLAGLPLNSAEAKSPLETAAQQPSPNPAGDERALELALWNAIQDSTDVAVFEDFLLKFPKGFLAGAARSRLDSLKNKVAVGIPGPPARSDPVSSSTLRDVRERGRIRCGVSTGLPGFSAPDRTGAWSGLDVDFCRAVSAAIFDDQTKIEFIPLSARDRFTSLQSGQIDVLARNTTKTAARETTLGLKFGAVNFFDGQAFMVRKSLKRKSALELSGASVCVQQGTMTEINATDYFVKNKMKIDTVAFATADEAVKAYDTGRCDALTNDLSALYFERNRLSKPGDHIILPEYITTEQLAPAVRQGDDQWLNIITWTHYAMVAAEELGIGRATADVARASANSSIQRLFGMQGNFGEGLGLSNDWVHRIIRHVGNYGEVYERNLGLQSPRSMERHKNALWTKGGLQQAPAMR